MKGAAALFQFLRDCAERGERATLVTLTAVLGSSARAAGSHMAVSESGAAIGSFSGGCVEAAVIAEARQVLEAGRARTIRFGAGSSYIDIRLPCGGGMDILFTPDPSLGAVRRICQWLEQRRPVALSLSEDGHLSARIALTGDRTGWRDGVFLARHAPELRLMILGHGAEPAALLRLAAGYGAELMLLSPDQTCVDDAARCGFPSVRLRTTGRAAELVADAYTAVIMLFHDHDWETDLLLQAFEQDAFFIGAMGSRRTHVERCERLLAAGASPRSIERLVGPVGLIEATRDPQTLAVSILAQVVERYESILRNRP